ncbi:hypothetical protein FJZ17_03300 [Candidatus Pacearchaeota archaeon]|nr:hypothetical protein [Candidatus Pacearchaeota archaeon]
MHQKSLIDRANFWPIFREFIGKKIGLVVARGNVGDKLIKEAAEQLFKYFNIDFEYVNTEREPDIFDEEVCKRVDEFAINGGGNMGNLYLNTRQRRARLLKYKKPITILPQTFNSKEDFNYKKVWVRELESLKFRHDAELAPDLALGYVYPGKISKPKKKLGVWIRTDVEVKKNRKIKSLGDPTLICKTTKQYILLAAKYEKIVTNRIHFAIAGLIAGRKVTLLPNSYFKNYSIWKTWLKHLGCEWNPFWQNEINNKITKK